MDNNESQSSWLQAATSHEADTIGDRSVISIGLFDCSARHGVLYDVLKHAAYVCVDIRTIEELATMLRRGMLDVLVVAGLARDGRSIETLNRLRTEIAPDVPLLIVGESDSADAESLALNAGADDYVLESRSPEVLIARVASLLRRNRRHQAARLERYGDYEFDTSRGIVTLRGSAVTLTQREFDLARLLFRHLNAPLSRAQIFESVWRQSFGVTSRTVDTHICWLRSKLQLHPANGYVVMSVHGYGYRLEAVQETF